MSLEQREQSPQRGIDLIANRIAVGMIRRFMGKGLSFPVGGVGDVRRALETSLRLFEDEHRQLQNQTEQPSGSLPTAPTLKP